MRIELPFELMGKPRMTRGDRWKKRACVSRYWQWKDAVKLIAGNIPKDACSVSWTTYFPMPKSWSKKKKAEMQRKQHRQKPDRDNCDKALLDALFDDDAKIADGTIRKLWDDGEGARTIVEIA